MESTHARIMAWEEITKPVFVSFIPEQSEMCEIAHQRTQVAIRNSYQVHFAFKCTHRLSFQDCAYRWRWMSPIKDIFLTSNMMLPRPKHSGVVGCTGLSLVSLPIRRLASTFQDGGVVSPIDVRELGKKALQLKALPHLRDFTMMCPRVSSTVFDANSDLDRDSLLSQYSASSVSPTSLDTDSSSSTTSQISRLDSILNTSWLDTDSVDSFESDAPFVDGDWYGFRYYQESWGVEFARLTLSDIQEFALAGEKAKTGQLPQTVVRMWIVRPDDKHRLGREPNHQWKELRMDIEAKDPWTNKAKTLWLLTRKRLESPAFVQPVMEVN
ncbi:hypothetical protein F66182_9856 [Fusarium sp. NRRL 66182]|nr:hypothetical protein F66182_9856 [Fusarium sp. NRRL 66182]